MNHMRSSSRGRGDGGQGDEGQEEEEQPQQQQQGRRRRFSLPNKKKKRRMPQLSTAASSSPSATAATRRSSSGSLGSLLLSSLRGKSGSKNNNSPHTSNISSVAQQRTRQLDETTEDLSLAALKKPLEIQHRPSQLVGGGKKPKEQMHHEPETNSATAKTILLGQFLMHDCPTDVLPRILAYAGPQTTHKLQRCNRFFHTVLNRQGTWRILCEELYKWKPGEPEPPCWKEHYRLNPCVPVDFKSILSAAETVGLHRGHVQHSLTSDDDDTSSVHDHHHAVEITRSGDLTVWLRPGRRYVLPRAVTISTLFRTNQVRIETQQLPEGSMVHRHDCDQDTNAQDNKKQVTTRPSPAILVSGGIDNNFYTTRGKNHRRLYNEPLFRVVRGTLVLRNVNLIHYSPGIDIWNGNAAIQVQPAAEQSLLDLSPWISNTSGTATSSDGVGADQPLPIASAILHQVQVQSSSGRGIVAVDGGQLHVQDSCIHDCAGTGVYVGGMASKATVIQTDILGNGTGNQLCTSNTAGGVIARGHSGVYVEQGTCVLDDCSVSQNSASGICVLAASAMDGFNFLNNNIANVDAGPLLTMRKTDVLASECSPLELPQPLQQDHLGQFPIVAAVRREGERVHSNNVFDPQHENNISPNGMPRPRSSVLRQVLSLKTKTFVSFCQMLSTDDQSSISSS